MKITRRQLRKIIQEAMYNPRARRDAVIDSLDEPYKGKIKSMVDDPDYGKTGNELLHSLAGYEPSADFPDADSYYEEVGQFDKKLSAAGQQQYEDKLTPEDKKLRKISVDHLFGPAGPYKIPVSSLTGNDPNRTQGVFTMGFMHWIELFPEDYLFDNNMDSSLPEHASIVEAFEQSAERVFNSMGGSWYIGDGETLLPLPNLTREDKLAFGQVILKVLNNDPQYV